jgi:hypothetical protein
MGTPGRQTACKPSRWRAPPPNLGQRASAPTARKSPAARLLPARRCSPPNPNTTTHRYLMQLCYFQISTLLSTRGGLTPIFGLFNKKKRLILMALSALSGAAT